MAAVDQLAAANPGLAQLRISAGQAELRPDGDLDVVGDARFVFPDCPACGGILKPDVVFFGESVPKDRVARAYAMVDAAEVRLNAGTSQTVHWLDAQLAHRAGRPNAERSGER